MSNFQLYSAYYDLLYKDKDYKAESDYIIQTMQQWAPSASQIIELGCGSGAHAQYVCEAGYHLTGIEKSETMLALAKAKNIQNFTPVLGDISGFALPQKFDVAVSLFHVLSYLTENDSLINCFKAVQEHLNPGGVFMFDLWYTPAVYTQKPETRIKRLENEAVEIIRIAESKMITEGNLVQVDFEVLIKDKPSGRTQTTQETHLMRHFSIPEIKMIAAYTGFEVVVTEAFVTKEKPSTDTWGVFFVLKKK